jgi:hypothetical protein
MNVAAIGSVLAGVSIRTPSSSEGISATLNDFGKLLEGTGRSPGTVRHARLSRR